TRSCIAASCRTWALRPLTPVTARGNDYRPPRRCGSAGSMSLRTPYQLGRNKRPPNCYSSPAPEHLIRADNARHCVHGTIATVAWIFMQVIVVPGTHAHAAKDLGLPA